MSPKTIESDGPQDDSQDYPTDPTATGIGDGDENGLHVNSIGKKRYASLGQSNGHVLSQSQRMGSPGHEGKRNVVALTPLGRVERFEVLLNGGDPIPSLLVGLGYFKDPLLSVRVVDDDRWPRTRGSLIPAIPSWSRTLSCRAPCCE